MWTSLPLFGSGLLLAVMVVAAYTFAVSLVAGANGKPRTLQAARFGAYGTVILILAAVLCLAYGFVSHDFRLRYVAHYSDRSMSTAYLLTALWGGQDGSILWWLFLLSLYIGVCVKWLGRRFAELQPYILATCMVVVLFFSVLMAFAANPFGTSVAGARPDGEGLNPLLQNFYMIIHPPSLYVGFVGCTIPFAFAIAALITGRLDTEWIVASRKFTLFSWMFLAIGNTLGMLWAYEELGWGGYWGWDPVENAAFMPLLTASAFVHSVMIQERRGLLKLWNVFLVSLTFLMTIFGTFLTRSGVIASVHSFAQSSIGDYFVGFLVAAVVVLFGIVLYRWPELRDYPKEPRLRKAALATGFAVVGIGIGAGMALTNVPMGPTTRAALVAMIAAGTVYVGVELVFRRMTRGLDLTHARPQIESIWSREFTFLLNNWGLLGFMAFVLVATTFPMISEAFWHEKVSVGAPYYNAWVQPIGLTIYALMGIGSLFGWKKTSDKALRRAFRWPLIALVGTAVLHFALGSRLGFPALAFTDPIYPGPLGAALRGFNGVTPVLGISLSAFNAAVIIQEFAMLFAARKRSGASKDVPQALWYAGLVPGFLYTLVTLPPPSRRRYGGYVVHFGIVFMFLGFTGASWNVNRETTMSPGQTYDVEGYTLTYAGPRMEVDTTKRMVFADLKVTKNGKDIGAVTPAKFIYKRRPEMPTTEVAMLHTVRDDLYVVVGSINPQTKVAALQIHVNPLVSWIWFGAIILIFGSVICMWPELRPQESRVWAAARGVAGATASITIGVVIAMMPVPAHAQSNGDPGASSLHAGTVKIDNPIERDVFGKLRCMCGSCPRDLLSSCACDTAEEARQKIRAQLAAGQSKDEIILAYANEYGAAALAIPPNTGAMRAIYVVPLVGIVAGGAGVVFLIRRWRKPGGGDGDAGGGATGGGKGGALAKADKETSGGKDEYDARLDDELRELDD
ncbi:MAG: cytochrome c-type biogenesis CcmF C-terminal domain-containing protein [Polyangiaceae bacterium]